MWAFANNDDIRRAIHAEPISKIGRFDECSDRIMYTHDTDSMIPVHAQLVSKGKKRTWYQLYLHVMCMPFLVLWTAVSDSISQRMQSMGTVNRAGVSSNNRVTLLSVKA